MMFTYRRFYRDTARWPFTATVPLATHSIDVPCASCDQGADHVPAKRHCP